MQWALLRAMEWLTWPGFISQPLVPILLYFYPWPWVIGSVVLISFAWRMVVAPVIVFPQLATAAVWFVKLRWVASPIMAFLIWQRDDYPIAALALAIDSHFSSAPSMFRQCHGRSSPESSPDPSRPKTGARCARS